MTTSTAAFRIHALPADVLDDIRAGGSDASGRPAERITADGGEPLRCCLRNADPGAELLLFGYRPPLPASPYQEVGAIIAHAGTCGGPAGIVGYPPDWRGRAQVLRAYDDRGWIHEATMVHDGQDPERVIAAVLDQPGVVRVHSRNVAWGCYMFTITRTD